MISNSLILSVVIPSGVLILVGAVLIHATDFLDDPELASNIISVSRILADVALFLLVVFMLLAALLRSDFHYWVRASLVAFAAVLLLFFLTAVYGVIYP
ncbi:MAG: hypothetical protein ACE5QF_09005 [Thermoplasmata archaeon]